MNNKTFATIVSTKSFIVKINNTNKEIRNTNELLGNFEGIYGIKTGFTNGANRCLVTSCKRNNMDIICVVLGADTKNFRTKDTIDLINYTFNNYIPVNVKDFINNNFNKWFNNNKNYFIIEKCKEKNLNLAVDCQKINIIPIKKDDIPNLKIEIDCNYILKSPIKKNTVLGKLYLKSNNDVILTCNIINTNDIYKKSIINYLSTFIKHYKINIKNPIF